MHTNKKLRNKTAVVHSYSLNIIHSPNTYAKTQFTPTPQETGKTTRSNGVSEKCLQIYLWTRVTSWPPKLKVSCSWPVDHLCQLASKSVQSFSKYRALRLPKLTI